MNAQKAANSRPFSRKEASQADRLYLSPNFKIQSDENEALFAQVRTVRAKLQGEDTALDLVSNTDCHTKVGQKDLLSRSPRGWP